MFHKLSVGSVALLALGLGLSSAAAQPTTAVCTTATVPGSGGFNQEAFCPTGKTATGGGYFLTTPDFSQLVGALVSESIPAFTGTTPCGWEVVGTNPTTLTLTIRVCVLCL
jgi:hypothetical protein